MKSLRDSLRARRAQTSIIWQWVIMTASLMCVCVLALAVLAGVLTHTSALVWSLLALGLAMTILGIIVTRWVARGRQRSLLRLTQAADRIRAGEGDVNIPTLGDDAETQLSSLALQRMLDAFRAQVHGLQAEKAVLEGRVEHRTRELTTLSELAHNLSTKTDIESLMNDTLRALEKTVDYSAASIWSRRKQEVALLSYRMAGLSGAYTGVVDNPSIDLTGARLSAENKKVYDQIEQARKPMVVNRVRRNVLSWLWSQLFDDACTSALYKASRSWMAVPLQTHEEVIGVMRVDHEQPDYFDPERERLLKAIGDQAGLAMHHAQLQMQARQFAVMTERTRIARDLHDAVSQTLFAANMLVGTLRKTIHTDPDLVPGQLTELQRLNQGALAEMRLMMFELRPDALGHADLGELLRQAVDAVLGRTDIKAATFTDSGSALPADVKVQLYRIAQEALSNIWKHSRAAHLTLEFHCTHSRRCLLRIADDGHGFDVDADHPGHFGLDNMRSRAAEIDADFSLQSQSGKGTDVTVIWPKEVAGQEYASEPGVAVA